MAPKYLRDAVFYTDESGGSEVMEQLKQVSRWDARGFRTIRNKIDLLRQMAFEDAVQSKLVKRPTATIYVLRVQSGPVSYRLPFFEPRCTAEPVVVFTHFEQRRDLRGDEYASVVVDAEALRVDWIERNCKER